MWWLRQFQVQRLLGAFGKVHKIEANNVVQVVFEDHKRFGLAPHSLRAEFLEHNGKLSVAKDLKGFVRQPRHLKRWLLQGAGVEHPELERLTAIAGLNDQASEDLFDLFSTCVEWSIGLGSQTRITYVLDRFARKILADARLEPEVEAIGLAEPPVCACGTSEWRSGGLGFGTLSSS